MKTMVNPTRQWPKKNNTVRAGDSGTKIAEDIEWAQHHPRDCAVRPAVDCISLEEPVGGVECKLHQNGTAAVIPQELCEIEQDMTHPDTSHGTLGHTQFHEERQDVTSKAARILPGEHFSVRDDYDDEGRDAGEQRDVATKLNDQCLLITTHEGRAKGRLTEQPADEREMTPQIVFHHLQQLEKLYRIGALASMEQYTKSRERLWTMIIARRGPAGRGGHQASFPCTIFQNDKRQTATAAAANVVLELQQQQQHLDRLLQLCQDGAITEKQYIRARDRIINNNGH
jgi:hypothetical protein